MPTTQPTEDLVERSEALCEEAEEAVLANIPGARSALGLAMFLKDIARARAALNGERGVETFQRVAAP